MTRCKTVVDKLDEREIAKPENCILYETIKMRNEFQVEPVEVPGILKDSGKLKSQMYCGSCLQRQNHLPFLSIRYAIQRVAGMQPSAFEGLLAKAWRACLETMLDLTANCVTGIGVGAWGTSDAFLFTTVRL